MKAIFFCQQFFYRFAIHFIGNAAVDGAHGGALGFFVEALALCAFVWNDVVGIDADGCVALTGVYGGAVEESKGSFNAATVGDSPFHTAFIDGIIRAFGLASAAVDAFFCYLNSHFVRIRE